MSLIWPYSHLALQGLDAEGVQLYLGQLQASFLVAPSTAAQEGKVGQGRATDADEESDADEDEEDGTDEAAAPEDAARRCHFTQLL